MATPFLIILVSVTATALISSSTPGIITIPATTPPTVSPTPVTVTPTTPPASSSGQKKWCVVKNGAAEGKVQAALDYACGTGKADCTAVQQGGRCYNPNTLGAHASYAFNSFFQRNPVPTSCDFGGTAAITNVNPSTGSCVFPTASSSSPVNGTSNGGMTPTGSLGGVLNPNVLSGGSSNFPGGDAEVGGGPPAGRRWHPLVVVGLVLALHTIENLLLG